MKLKGKNAQRLSKEDRKKKEETLKVMEETRVQDTQFLRRIIKKKLEWAEAEKQKLTAQFEQLKKKIIALNGAIIVLKELAEIKYEKLDDTNKG